MALATLKPNDRYAIIGKTGSGKSTFGMVLAGTFALSLQEPWEVWWIDTKGDKDDIKALRKWGFRNAASKKDMQNGGLPNAKYFHIVGSGENSTVDQAQAVIRKAYQRKHVLIVVDEYTQVTYSRQTAGSALMDVFARGRGLDVGLIGMTQEPVFVPRQLISQATHLVLFSLTHNYDVKYAKQIYPQYVAPIERGDPNGFYWSWVDGNSKYTYYPNQAKWYDELQVALPKNDEEGSIEISK